MICIINHLCEPCYGIKCSNTSNPINIGSSSLILPPSYPIVPPVEISLLDLYMHPGIDFTVSEVTKYFEYCVKDVAYMQYLSQEIIKREIDDS